MGLFDIFKIGEIKQMNQKLLEDNTIMHNQLSELGAADYFKVKQMTEHLTVEYEKRKAQEEIILKNHLLNLDSDCQRSSADLAKLHSNINLRTAELEKLIKSTKTQTNKLSRSKELVSAINYTFSNYLNYEPGLDAIKLSNSDLSALEEFCPSIILKLHCMDVKDLRKAYKDNDKLITQVLDKYASRYTTKANKAIYSLMVIALRAELQNILYNLKFEKLDKATDDVKEVTQKYLKIAGEGNQSIIGTLTKFIGEIEHLFMNAVKIEYNYYVKKEQAKQEQMALREQIRQEVEERKALEAEKKKIEKEESKYNTEISKLQDQLVTADTTELDALNARILELQAQLETVASKKEEISNLANGKAGNVYIISNLGSFGENMFKIGMTRRLDPQDRVNELGDASVPFKFDVHSFIFSDDAVGLESKLHNIMNDKRVNKVNLRKEFFYTSIDELENLVSEIAPTAEFTRTMLAEDFRQSQSSDVMYTSDAVINLDTDE